MKILVSGSHGLVGAALVAFLTQKGYSVSRLTRPGPDNGAQDAGVVRWDPLTGSIDISALEGFDAVIHLAGESIATGRWNGPKKQRIRESRVQGTRVLTDALTALKQPPKTYLSAAAIGYYGDRGNETLKEDSTLGRGFLAEVCRDWEAATTPATVKGIRVANLRFGVILSSEGGALAKMLPPFKMGVGGKIGPGTQYISWIALEDVLGAILHTLNNPLLKGPINVVAPGAVTNLDYTKTLGRVLSRPTIFPMPTFAAKLAFGDMADELLLASQKVEPGVLTKTGYTFQYPNLESALRHILKK